LKQERPVDRDTPGYAAWIERRADVWSAVFALIGGGMIDQGGRIYGWIVLVVAVACMFQRIRSLEAKRDYGNVRCDD
jgi:hypothetical protein